MALSGPSSSPPSTDVSEVTAKGFRRWLAGGGAAVAIVVLVMILGGGGNEATTISPGPTVPPIVSTVSSEPSTTTAAAPAAAVAPTTEAPPPFIPDGLIPDGTASEACEAIVERLLEYRGLAVESGYPGLPTLQFALEEFENQVDLISQDQDWGLAMLEQLYQVRRDWSTAYTAHNSGDAPTAEARFESALGYLDAAVAVPCP